MNVDAVDANKKILAFAALPLQKGRLFEKPSILWV